MVRCGPRAFGIGVGHELGIREKARCPECFGGTCRSAVEDETKMGEGGTPGFDHRRCEPGPIHPRARAPFPLDDVLELLAHGECICRGDVQPDPVLALPLPHERGGERGETGVVECNQARGVGTNEGLRGVRALAGGAERVGVCEGG